MIRDRARQVPSASYSNSKGSPEDNLAAAAAAAAAAPAGDAKWAFAFPYQSSRKEIATQSETHKSNVTNR